MLPSRIARMYEDVTRQAGAPRELTVAGTTFVLRVESGPAAGRGYTIDAGQPGPLLVGEGPACTIKLGDRLVSRRHASLDVEERGLRLQDLGSTNGTFVHGVRVLDALLKGGELIALGESTLRVELPQPSQVEVPGDESFGRALGRSPEMRRLYPVLAKLAASDVPVVIEGETGTGKELLAEVLHEASARRAGPFVVFDCTSLPASLAESELFGHERGAFTGAVSSRSGLFEQASGGTLLIDEIGDLDASLQPKLLRVLERREIRRVGGNEVRRVDVRILAATRRNLDEEVVAGRFRDDLYHRLMVTRVELPPLRRRHGDIALLASRFWREAGGDGGPPAEALSRWETEHWAGNVRELRNAVARTVALGEHATLAAYSATARGSLPPPPSSVMDEVLLLRLPLPQARQRVIDAFEQRYVEQVLQEHGGDTARAAAASGIARRYFNLLRARHR